MREDHQNERPNGLKGGGGLEDEDKRQAALRDASPRITPGGPKPDVLLQIVTPSEAAQSGADVRSPTLTTDDPTPEGLKRERTHALNPTDGRGGPVPGHIPSSKE